MQTIPDIVQEVNDATLFILIVSIVFLVGIVAFMLYCVIRFHKSKNPTPAKIEGHLGLEILWTVIP
ncbi:MAG: cytochrome c oxidase subunit II, partial [Planctomycetota bacterium]